MFSVSLRESTLMTDTPEQDKRDEPLTIKLGDACPQLEKLRRQLEIEREQAAPERKRQEKVA